MISHAYYLHVLEAWGLDDLPGLAAEAAWRRVAGVESKEKLGAIEHEKAPECLWPRGAPRFSQQQGEEYVF